MFSGLFILTALLVCCSSNYSDPSHMPDIYTELKKNSVTNPLDSYKKIREIPLPPGYIRLPHNPASFASWLSHLELKKEKTVFLFNGKPKANQQAQYAVLNLSVGKQDLQQCADAVMRLRAEYLYSIQDYRSIRFTDNENHSYTFSPPYTHKHLLAYLQKVFGMCGSASLSKQLKRVALSSIQPGDVIIRGGFPGHAVIVLDVAVNEAGYKIYLIAQSYMPAQDIHILLNPADKNLSPWYAVKDDFIIETPEYTFTKEEVKRW